jgi:hypothetical protein
MATKPLPSPATPGQLSPRRRRVTTPALWRALVIVLAITGTIALALLVFGLLGVHAVTAHLRLH